MEREAAVRELLARQQTGSGARGVVAASAAIAAGIGADLMRRGGNAYDAALGAALAETVLLPSKCGLAGDLIALVVEPGAEVPEALIAIGGAADALGDAARREGLTETGPLSVGVPGAPAGYAALAERGQLDRGTHVAAALRLATDGVPWAPINVALAAESRELVLRHQPTGTSFHPAAGPVAAGEVVRAPGLATVLAAWRDLGAGLLQGAVGDAIVDRVQQAGGVLTRDDLRHARASWEAAMSVETRGHRLWATPAPTHGPSLLDAVRGFDGAGAGALWDATQAAISARRRTLADPHPDDGTSMVSAVDGDGRVVVVIHSNSFPRFGSGLAVDELDLVLNNRAGRGFSADPTHPNFPRPGQRPATTLHAWALGRTTPELLGATPGGANQMIWNAQTVTAALDGERDPGTLVTAPRWEWLPGDDGVRVEDDLGAAATEALAARATRLERTGPLGLRSAQQVIVRPAADEVRVAASDPRTGGVALGI